MPPPEAASALPPPQAGLRWYLVRAITGRETFAVEQLERQGFVTFLPKQPKTIRHARRLSVRLAAYFPGYLFVRLDLARQRWRSINGTLGVSHLVGPGERPAPVPKGVVEALIAAADARGVLEGPPLQAGQQVRIIAGAFADKLAIIERLDEAGRVRVLLDIVSGRVPVTIAREMLGEAS
jgi:transcription elongation factor/antiterminator RfaH